MSMTVGELEAALFNAFAREDAESWDQPGLSVGDRSCVVSGVALNLDQSAAAVIAAEKAGCNVLVTHHPPFIKGGPTELGPATQDETSGPGKFLYEAAARGISCIAMHTNADRAVCVREKFAEMLGYECIGNFEHLLDASRDMLSTGYGALLKPPANTTLAQVAQRAKDAFEVSPRVWGRAERPIRTIALLNGSWSEPELYDVCVKQGIDCAIVGETRYHFCTDASPALSIIDLGHDMSELPIVEVLQNVVCAAGIAPEDVCNLGLSANNWWTL